MAARVKRVTFTISERTYERLVDRAQNTNSSISAVVSEAVEAHLKVETSTGQATTRDR